MKKIVQRCLLVMILLVVIIAGYLWVVLLGPWGYQYPQAYYPATDAGVAEAQVADKPHHVFVYGTLRYRPVRLLVMGTTGAPRAATLEGYRREGLDLERDREHQVEGMLLSVTTPQLRRLDRYERLGVRYEREQIELTNGVTAWVYLRRRPQS
ncbi:MAG TPA: gamma-glutamylcyclotransferase family protein [Cellvibrionaceae bacterium]